VTSGTLPVFDVRSEPWLPVLDGDGRVREVGIIEGLAHAHELRGLAASTPLEHVALLRLLVAITHRALDGPRTLAEGQALHDAGRIPTGVIEYVESDAGVWDLFDPARPWLQAPSAATDAAGASPLARLFPWQPAGNNPAFWEHTRDDEPVGRSPGEAARGLLITQVFALGGGVSKPFNLTDGTIAGTLVCLAEGDTLAETILLNTVRYTADEPLPRTGGDVPAWERAERSPEKGGTLLDGYVDLLTLSTRRVLLDEPDADGLISRCRYVQGLTPREIGARDPFVPYRRTEKGLVPLRPNRGRSLWRDLSAIAAGLADPELRASTGVLLWAGQLKRGAPVRLRVVGVVRNQAIVATVVDGTLRIPQAIADSVDHRHAVEEALVRAERAEKSLRYALRVVAEQLGTASDADVIARRLLRAASFWVALEAPFGTLIDELATLDAEALAETDVEPLRIWAKTLVREARRAYEDATDMLGDAARPLVAAARGRDRLQASLYKHVLPPAVAGAEA
jgi:CRISPR system Cascade subunit CasA